jgi:hypothetical protein
VGLVGNLSVFLSEFHNALCTEIFAKVCCGMNVRMVANSHSVCAAVLILLLIQGVVLVQLLLVVAISFCSAGSFSVIATMMWLSFSYFLMVSENSMR